MASFPKEHIARLATEQMPADESPISELIAILLRRRRLILAVVILLTALSTLYGLSIVPEYTAAASVMVEPRESRVVDVEQVMPGLAAESATVQERVLGTQIDIIRSRDLIVQTMEDLDLFNDPEFGAVTPEEDSPGMLPEWLRHPLRAASGLAAQWVSEVQRIVGNGLTGTEQADSDVEPMSSQQVAPSPEEEARAAAIATFRGNLDVTQSGRSYVLWISYTSLDPIKAFRIANRHAENYIESQLRTRREATGRANAWLSERLQTLQDGVLEAERAVARFQAENELVTAEGTGLSVAQLMDLNRALIETRAERAGTEAKLGLVRKLKASGEDLGSITEVVASPLISNLRQQQAELVRQEADLGTTYGERHPQMQALREERAKLAAGIAEEVNRIIRSLENELTVIATRERNLEQALQSARSENAVENEAAVRLRELEREATARRALYETLLMRYQETKTQEGLLEPGARVVFPADVPWGPSTPSPKIFAAVGFTASAVLGCMLALLLEQLDKGMRSSRQIERVLQVPCLGLVPRVSGLRRDQTLNSYLLNRPHSRYAEGMSALYTGTLVTEADPPPKVILVTSALPGEGKTTVASSLATTAAQSGRKTLLMDLDLRRPGIAREFGLQPAAGVAEVIADVSRFDEALVTDDVAGVDVLPVAWTPAKPAALLTSPRLGLLFHALRDRYDCIVVDSPPVIGIADARVLSLYADATLFVIRWERTKRDAAVAGVRILRDASANVAGAVLTQVNLKKHARYRYGDAGQYLGAYGKYYRD